MMMAGGLAAVLIAALLAPFICKQAPKRGSWLLALGPLICFAMLLNGGYFSDTPAQVFSYEWMPQLNASFDLRLDGLSLLMALLISGIGTLITLYAGAYLKGHAMLGRFMLYLLAFTTSMLGLVMADNLVLLFVFWELTSITSYLLIGFNNEEKESRWKALQALLITGMGGVAMLAGFVLIAQAAGTWSISELLTMGDVIRNHAHYPAIVSLVLLGAFTKSAQIPFHFWLPNAMAAPTPVSAFLHSATMVKAGVYLMARFTPILGSTDAWSLTLTLFGAATMLTGGVLGLAQTDLKRILAYTTLSVLGILTMLLGLGSDYAIKSAMLFLFGHALYKATLFMCAGSVDHAVHTRDVERLGGLLKLMPITGAAALLAALSKAGFPPFVGFIGKEYVYKTGLALEGFESVILLAAIAGNMLLFALAFKAGVHPFWSKKPKAGYEHKPHEGPAGLWLGPIILAILGLLAGLFPSFMSKRITAPAATAIAGHDVDIKVALWHGFNMPLLLSAITVAGGLTLYALRRKIWRDLPDWVEMRLPRVESLYEKGFAGLIVFSKWQTRILQTGYMRHYLYWIVGFTVVLISWKFLAHGGLPKLHLTETPDIFPLGLCLLMCISAVVTVISSKRLSSLIALGVVGYGIALLFAYYSAPDLAITQILVESLTLVLFMFVVYRLPSISQKDSKGLILRDVLFSGAVGFIITGMILKALHLQFSESISTTLAQWSYLEAKGKNIVNVILVDFRALDTFGEITVLAVAALGVAALIRNANKEDKR